MTVQLIIVYVIGAAVAVYLIVKLIGLFSNKKGEQACIGCPLVDACAKPKDTRDGCEDARPKKKKKSCCQ